MDSALIRSSVISGWEWMRRKDSLSEANAHLLLEIIQGCKAFQGDRTSLKLPYADLTPCLQERGGSTRKTGFWDTAIALEDNVRP